MTPSEIKRFVTDLYKQNNFVQLCGIKIIDIKCGEAIVGITASARHANLNGRLHGGVTTVLIDNTLGVAAASVGKRVVTVSLTTSFLKSAPLGARIEAHGRLTYMDEKIVCLETKVYNAENGDLLSTGLSTGMTIALFDGIPEKWSD